MPGAAFLFLVLMRVHSEKEHAYGYAQEESDFQKFQPFDRLFAN